MFQKMLMLIACLFLTVSIVGCNTVRGVGEDVQSGGNAISNGSKAVSQKL